MGVIVFRDRRPEKIEVSVALGNSRANFGLGPGQEEPVKCRDGEVVTWGWFPFFGPGKGNAEPDCPAEDGDIIDVVSDCRIEG